MKMKTDIAIPAYAKKQCSTYNEGLAHGTGHDKLTIQVPDRLRLVCNLACFHAYTFITSIALVSEEYNQGRVIAEHHFAGQRSPFYCQETVRSLGIDLVSDVVLASFKEKGYAVGKEVVRQIAELIFRHCRLSLAINNKVYDCPEEKTYKFSLKNLLPHEVIATFAVQIPDMGSQK